MKQAALNVIDVTGMAAICQKLIDYHQDANVVAWRLTRSGGSSGAQQT
jgi:hypothetical protein